MTQIIVPDNDNLLLDGPYLDSPSVENVSAWTGARKVVGGPGAEVWHGRVTIGALATEQEERQWRAFLFALYGRMNWFKVLLPCAVHSGNRPTVAAGATNAYTLALSGMTPSTTILTAGQWMTVPLPSGRFRAVCLLNNLTSDGGGNATAHFAPALTETPTAGATVETKNPFIPFASAENRLGFSLADGVSGTSFDVREYR